MSLQVINERAASTDNLCDVTRGYIAGRREKLYSLLLKSHFSEVTSWQELADLTTQEVAPESMPLPPGE